MDYFLPSIIHDYGDKGASIYAVLTGFYAISRTFLRVQSIHSATNTVTSYENTRMHSALTSMSSTGSVSRYTRVNLVFFQCSAHIPTPDPH
eukprot:CFRG4190T1